MDAQKSQRLLNCISVIETIEKAGHIFVIRPAQPLAIGRMENDPEKVQQVYDIGYADGQKYLSDMLKWMQK